MNDELDYEAISRDAREFLEQSTEKEEEQVVQEEAAENENDHLIVDGQDLRNHPEFERLRLDIPWQEGEGGWGYQKKYPEIMERNHTLEKMLKNSSKENTLLKAMQW